MKSSPSAFSVILMLAVNCLTMYKKEIPDYNFSGRINKIMIKIDYKNLNPGIDSFEKEPEIDEDYINSIAVKHDIKNIVFARDSGNTSDSTVNYDLTINIQIYFYPTIQNATVLFLFPAVSSTKFEFNTYDKKAELLHSAIISRENIYFFLCLPLSLFFFDDNADEKILNEYFYFLSKKIINRN